MSHDNDHETTSNSDRAITELEMLQYLAGEEIDPVLLPQAVAIELALHDDLIPDEDTFDGEEDAGSFASHADTVMPARDYSLATFERLQFAPYKDTMAAKGPIQPGHQACWRDQTDGHVVLCVPGHLYSQTGLEKAWRGCSAGERGRQPVSNTYPFRHQWPC